MYNAKPFSVCLLLETSETPFETGHGLRLALNLHLLVLN